MIDGLAQFLENQRSTVTHCTSYIIPDVGIITVTTEFEPFDHGEES